jgi:hypothetical protein
VNYKVYMAKDVNAFAMANGCIRVYSGLMDMMTDNEVEAVIVGWWRSNFLLIACTVTPGGRR